MFEEKNSKYCYEGTNVLINKMNIKDFEELKKYEMRIVSLKLVALHKMGISGDFTKQHFINIHKFMFEDLYDFAGKIRTENIAKDNFRFADVQFIDSEMDRIFNELQNENFLEGISKEKLAERLAYYWGELNVLHPFREGNGRVTREFLRQLALKNGYELSLKNADALALLDASIESIVDTEDLKKILIQCLEKI